MSAYIIPIVFAVAMSLTLPCNGAKEAPGYVCGRAARPVTAQEDRYQVTVSGLGPLRTKVLKEVIPDYPAWARTETLEGVVVVDVMVSTSGRVTKVRATSGPSRLRPVAERAARQWVFRPIGLATGPVRVKLAMTFTFAKTVSPSDAAQLAHAAERAQRDRADSP